MTIGSRGSESVTISEIDPTAKTLSTKDQHLFPITGQSLIRNLVYQVQREDWRGYKSRLQILREVKAHLSGMENRLDAALRSGVIKRSEALCNRKSVS